MIDHWKTSVSATATVHLYLTSIGHARFYQPHLPTVVFEAVTLCPILHTSLRLLSVKEIIRFSLKLSMSVCVEEKLKIL